MILLHETHSLYEVAWKVLSYETCLYAWNLIHYMDGFVAWNTSRFLCTKLISLHRWSHCMKLTSLKGNSSCHMDELITWNSPYWYVTMAKKQWTNIKFKNNGILQSMLQILSVSPPWLHHLLLDTINVLILSLWIKILLVLYSLRCWEV